MNNSVKCRGVCAISGFLLGECRPCLDPPSPCANAKEVVDLSGKIRPSCCSALHRPTDSCC